MNESKEKGYINRDSRLLIKNKDGILYAAIIEKHVYVKKDRRWKWFFHSVDHISAQDQGEARFGVLSKYNSQDYRLVSIAPVIGVFGTEQKGIQI